MKCLLILLLSITLVFTNEVAVQEFTNGNNLFAASAYKELLKDGANNFLISPLSAEIILALTQSGCRGETAKEIQSALHLSNNNEKVESAVKTLLPALKSNEDYTLHTANKIYIQDKFTLKEKFVKTASEIYQAETERIDFSKNIEAAKTMNEWVEKHTANKIHNLIDPAILDGLTRAVLINALYFKGNWSKQFDNYTTQQKNFYKTSQDIMQVDTMHHYSEHFKYHESLELNAKFLELPFKGGDISMTIILPNEKEGLTRLENQIEKVFSPQDLKSEVVNVALPKFKIETKIDFKGILLNLGVKKAFGESDADLSGIAGNKGDIIIKEVVQKTFIDVGEGGVEAAAATAVVIAAPSSAVLYPVVVPKEFIADHPFIFYIKANGLIMFAGRVSVPE